MAVPIPVPDLGSGNAGGIVAEWHVADGAVVDTGELICRVESDFIAVELEADGPGFLQQRSVAGAVESVGSVVALILAPGEVSADGETPVVVAELPAADAELVAVVVEEIEPAPPSEPEIVPTTPLPEFEEALVEAIVVPFPKKFAGTSPRAWDAVPGDAVQFDSALFGESEHQRTDLLEEPGGSIPGLPLWEPEDKPGQLSETERRFARVQQGQRLWHGRRENERGCLHFQAAFGHGVPRVLVAGERFYLLASAHVQALRQLLGEHVHPGCPAKARMSVCLHDARLISEAARPFPRQVSLLPLLDPRGKSFVACREKLRPVVANG